MEKVQEKTTLRLSVNCSARELAKRLKVGLPVMFPNGLRADLPLRDAEFDLLEDLTEDDPETVEMALEALLMFCSDSSEVSVSMIED